MKVFFWGGGEENWILRSPTEHKTITGVLSGLLAPPQRSDSVVSGPELWFNDSHFSHIPNDADPFGSSSLRESVSSTDGYEFRPKDGGMWLIWWLWLICDWCAFRSVCRRWVDIGHVGTRFCLAFASAKNSISVFLSFNLILFPSCHASWMPSV